MAKFKAVVNTSFGEVHVEADSLEELKGSLKLLGIGFDRKADGKGRTKEHRVVVQHPEGVTTPDGKVPDEIISKFHEMTNPDIAMAILLYEVKDASKEQIIERSKTLGKPIPSIWATHFNRDMAGDVAVSRREGRVVYYKLSDGGRLKAKKRMEELLKGVGKE